MAEFLSVECNYKRVKKDITKAWRKADEGDSENPEEPEKKRTKTRKTKRPEAEAEEAPEPEEPKAAAKSKSKAKKRSRPSKWREPALALGSFQCFRGVGWKENPPVHFLFRWMFLYI